MSSPVRIFICDDVPELRELMRAELEGRSGVRVVGEAGDGAEGIAGVARTAPDVVLLDLAMPGMDGLEALPHIREAAPDAAVLVFSGFSEGRLGPLSLERGADRYIEKGEPIDVILEVAREAVARRRSSGDSA